MSGTLLEKWINKTTLHPKGVCEAATMQWLSRIDQKGLAYARKLTPQECDGLQFKVEEGETFVFLLPEMLLPTSTFCPLSPIPTNFDSLDALNPGDFIFVSADGRPGVGGHAMGIYKNAKNLLFFDPEFGIYSYDPNGMDLTKVLDRTKNYGEAAYCKGTFTPPSKP